MMPARALAGLATAQTDAQAQNREINDSPFRWAAMPRLLFVCRHLRSNSDLQLVCTE